MKNSKGDEHFAACPFLWQPLLSFSFVSKSIFYSQCLKIKYAFVFLLQCTSDGYPDSELSCISVASALCMNKQPEALWGIQAFPASEHIFSSAPEPWTRNDCNFSLQIQIGTSDYLSVSRWIALNIIIIKFSQVSKSRKQLIHFFFFLPLPLSPEKRPLGVAFRAWAPRGEVRPWQGLASWPARCSTERGPLWSSRLLWTPPGIGMTLSAWWRWVICFQLDPLSQAVNFTAGSFEGSGEAARQANSYCLCGALDAQAIRPPVHRI